jgi:hypothetical protein
MDPGANTDFQHEAVAPNGAVLLGFFSQAQSFRLRRKISGGGNDGCPPKFKELGTDFGGPRGERVLLILQLAALFGAKRVLRCAAD